MKSVHILKIVILSHVFTRLTQKESQALHRLVCFVFTLYGRYFLSAGNSFAAPRHDLELWCKLQMYSHVDNVLAGAITSLKRHLWHLVPELVVLLLFDDKLPIDEKQIMAATLITQPRPAQYDSRKSEFQPVIDLLSGDTPSLAVFINERSWLIFELSAPYLAKTRPVPGQDTPLALVVANTLAWQRDDLEV